MERLENVINSGDFMEYKVPLAGSFDLEKAVCSHGFFMTAPNEWDPLTKTLERPLRLPNDGSVTVQISQPPLQSTHLLVRVFDTDSLTPAHQQSLTEQVRRMLSLSEAEQINVTEFQEIYAEAKASGLGRIFRSPTLFEDMVKCILVCNCQWSRTLSMASALCELQLELSTEGHTHETPTTKFAPKTPARKETTTRKIKLQDKSRNVSKRCSEVKSAMEADVTSNVGCAETSINIHEPDSSGGFVSESIEKTELPSHSGIGNFPSPKELASLDVNFLGKRCNLGYRESHILGFAQSVVEGRIQLRQLEEDSSESLYPIT